MGPDLVVLNYRPGLRPGQASVVLVHRKFGDLGFTHEFSNGYSAVDPSAELPGVHLVASLLKRWVAGTLHHHVSLEHLPNYLDEYNFRFNRRRVPLRRRPRAPASRRNRRRRAPAVTAEHLWADLDLDVTIDTIRARQH